MKYRIVSDDISFIFIKIGYDVLFVKIWKQEEMYHEMSELRQ